MSSGGYRAKRCGSVQKESVRSSAFRTTGVERANDARREAQHGLDNR